MPPKKSAAFNAQTPNKAIFPAKSAALPPAWKTYVPAWMTQATAWKTYAATWKTNAGTWKTYAAAWTTSVPAWKTHAAASKTDAGTWNTPVPRAGVMLAAGLWAVQSSMAQPAGCQQTWRSLDGGIDDTNPSFIHKLAIWDVNPADSVAPWIIAGGNFLSVNGTHAGGLARWDGSSGQGMGLTGPSIIYAVTPWVPDGAGPQASQLIIGGIIGPQGALPESRVARLTEAGFGFLGDGLNNSVFALTTWDPDGDGPLSGALIAGGAFHRSGLRPIERVARWSGTQWEQMGSGLSDSVSVLTTWDADGPGPSPARLVAGGRFRMSGASAVNFIAMWDGAAWQSMAGGMNDAVVALAAWDPDAAGPLATRLVAAGDFTQAGGASAAYVAIWDGTMWSALPPGPGLFVRAVTPWDHDGDANTADALAVARNGQVIDITWGATQWRTVGSSVINGPGSSIRALCFAPATAGAASLFCAGAFSQFGPPAGPMMPARRIASFGCPAARRCDDIDFNNNTVFPEDADVIDFFNVLAGAECVTCNDIDFNNNGVFPEDQDVIDFFNVLAGGSCP